MYLYAIVQCFRNKHMQMHANYEPESEKKDGKHRASASRYLF